MFADIFVPEIPVSIQLPKLKNTTSLTYYSNYNIQPTHRVLVINRNQEITEMAWGVTIKSFFV